MGFLQLEGSPDFAENELEVCYLFLRAKMST